jgi:hypothetical protein
MPNLDDQSAKRAANIQNISHFSIHLDDANILSIYLQEIRVMCLKHKPPMTGDSLKYLDLS